jgi:hypothetical protein
MPDAVAAPASVGSRKNKDFHGFSEGQGGEQEEAGGKICSW